MSARGPQRIVLSLRSSSAISGSRHLGCLANQDRIALLTAYRIILEDTIACLTED